MILYLTPFIALIWLVGAQEESNCTCGQTTANGIDFGGPTFIQRFKDGAPENENFSKVLESINDFSNRVDQHVCYQYNVDSDFQLEVSSSKPEQERFCQNVDGYKHCTIKSHNFSTEGCYPPQLFCIGAVHCSSGAAVAMPPSSGRFQLTRNLPTAFTKCTDSMILWDINDLDDQEFLSGTNKYCGTDPFREKGNNPLFFQFSSSQYCQNCGFLFFITCNSSEPQGQQGMPGMPGMRGVQGPQNPSQRKNAVRLFLDTFNRQMLFQVRRIILIPRGHILRFQAQTIKLSANSRVVAEYKGIFSLLVFDESTKCYYSLWRKSRQNFTSYGVLYIGKYKAWYIIREQVTEEAEAAYLRRAVEFLEPFYYTGGPPVREFRENQHGRMDAEQAQNCAEFDDPGCTECEKPPCPTLIQQRTALLDSMEFSLISNNSLVQSYTTWVIDLLSRNNENRGFRLAIRCPVLLSPIES